MAHEFRLPDIGEGLTEAEIVAWLVDDGDHVDEGDVVVEVETAKTTVDIPSPFTGTVLMRRGDEGDSIEVGDVLFVIGEPGESPPIDDGPSASVADEPSPAAASAHRDAVKAVPAVRRLAEDVGVDLSAIVGSGPGGAVTKADVEAAASGAGERTPLSATRRAIAAHMAESWTTIPHVTVQAEVRADAIVETLRNGGHRVETLVSLVVLPLLERYPEFNSRFDSDAAVHHPDRKLGFAVDTDAGLLVVVVRDAASMTAADLDAEIGRLQDGARTGALTPDEAAGQSFTISNIGALGGGHGTPIIPMDTSAIVSIGRATQQPVVEDGSITVGWVAPLDLSYDHRLIDGGLGQRFLADLVDGLERVGPEAE